MAYKRYGDEWEKEVLRNPKKLIVAMLRDVAKERDDLYAAQEVVVMYKRFFEKVAEIAESDPISVEFARMVIHAMRETYEAIEGAQHRAQLTMCQCGDDCIPMLGEDTCVRCDLPLAHSN
jgi:hypothetical protein